MITGSGVTCLISLRLRAKLLFSTNDDQPESHRPRTGTPSQRDRDIPARQFVRIQKEQKAAPFFSLRCQEFLEQFSHQLPLLGNQLSYFGEQSIEFVPTAIRPGQIPACRRRDAKLGRSSLDIWPISTLCDVTAALEAAAMYTGFSSTVRAQPQPPVDSSLFACPAAGHDILVRVAKIMRDQVTAPTGVSCPQSCRRRTSHS